MTPNTEKDPALLEQARAIVKEIKPVSLYDEVDKRMPHKPGYTLRYDDLKTALAVEVAYETLVRAGQAAPVDQPTTNRDLVDVVTGVLDQRGMLDGYDERRTQQLCEELQTAIDNAQPAAHQCANPCPTGPACADLHCKKCHCAKKGDRAPS